MVAFGTFVASSLLLLSPSTYAQSSSSTDIVNTKKDHRKVEELVEEFEKAEDSRSKTRIIPETLRELEVHSKLEETLIYPAIRAKLEDREVMDEALEEHHVAHVLIKELKRMKIRDERYEAIVTVLGESIKRHVKEEEGKEEQRQAH